MISERLAEVNGVELCFAEGPDTGPPLLLMPGFPDPWREWLPVIPALANRWHVHALSIRGLGGSGPAGTFEPGDLVDDVIAFVRDVIGEPTFVLGHSGGSVLSAAAAGREPELFRALVIGDVPLAIEWHVELGSALVDSFANLGELVRRRLPMSEMLAEYALLPSALGGTIADHTDIVGRLRMMGDVRDMDPDLLSPWTDRRFEEFGQIFDTIPGDYAGPIMFIACDPTAGGLLGPELLTAELERYPQAHHVTLHGKDHGMGLYTWEVSALLAAASAFLEAYR